MIEPITRLWLAGAALAVAISMPAAAQRPTLDAETLKYVSVDAPVIALVHAKVVDGTGAAPRLDQTVLIEADVIRAIGSASAVQVPTGARVIDATGKTVIPGLVHMHEHLSYPLLPGKSYGYMAETFTKLYLAGGVTSMRTAGTFHFAGDLRVRDSINAGKQPGPWIDVTGPYINGPNSMPQMLPIHTPEEAVKWVNFYADEGATSFKAYHNLTRAQLSAAIQAAHARGLKITGHLCSVTFREAADLGIDDLEHGLLVATDFIADKQPDQCPSYSTSALDADRAKIDALLDYLVLKNVAYTSTLAVIDTARSSAGMEVMAPDVRALFENDPSEHRVPPDSPMPNRIRQLVAVAKSFYDKGGLLLVGSDPGPRIGGVVPGFANHHEIEILVDGGFTFEQALKASTLNGATYLGKAERIGSIAAGKQADLILVAGDPAANVRDLRKVEIVFKQGVGYDPRRLIDSVRGKAGLY